METSQAEEIEREMEQAREAEWTDEENGSSGGEVVRGNILSAITARDIAQLQKIAFQPGGFQDSDMRARAWLVLCGIWEPVVVNNDHRANIRRIDLDGKEVELNVHTGSDVDGNEFVKPNLDVNTESMAQLVTEPVEFGMDSGLSVIEVVAFGDMETKSGLDGQLEGRGIDKLRAKSESKYSLTDSMETPDKAPKDNQIFASTTIKAWTSEDVDELTLEGAENPPDADLSQDLVLDNLDWESNLDPVAQSSAGGTNAGSHHSIQLKDPHMPPPTRDAPQVLADARRGFAQWSPPPAPLAPHHRLLHLHLRILLHLRPHLHYYQGLHSVAALIILMYPKSQLAASAVLVTLCDTIFYDHALCSFRGTMAILDLLLPCIHLAQPALHALLHHARDSGWPGLHPCVPWLVAGFAHDVADRAWVERVWDVLLAGTGAVGLVWAAVGVVVARQVEVEKAVKGVVKSKGTGLEEDDESWDTGFDPSVLHKIISRDPSIDISADWITQFVIAMTDAYTAEYITRYARPGGGYDSVLSGIAQGQPEPRVTVGGASAILTWRAPSENWVDVPREWDPARGSAANAQRCADLDHHYQQLDLDANVPRGRSKFSHINVRSARSRERERAAEWYLAWWFGSDRRSPYYTFPIPNTPVTRVAVGMGLTSVVVGVVAWGWTVYAQKVG
ncbi:hypothetical protein HDU93_009094 [Gonapodya sp. JEL0774]|nr:hypothetical protein HDU93_009094 [Gonapodya sp. JEL0774]